MLHTLITPFVTFLSLLFRGFGGNLAPDLLHSGMSSDPWCSEASDCQVSSVHLQLQGSCPSQRFLLYLLCLPPDDGFSSHQSPLGWGRCMKSLLSIQKLWALQSSRLGVVSVLPQ